MWWLGAVSLVFAGAVVAGCYAAPSESSAAALSKAVRVVSVDKVNDRTRDVLIDSPSVGEAKVRLLLPVGFEADPNRRWPVLYLLHGADDPDTYKCWTRSTDVAALTAGLPLLVVMPEGGTDGYYSDWFNKGRGGPPAGRPSIWLSSSRCSTVTGELAITGRWPGCPWEGWVPCSTPPTRRICSARLDTKPGNAAFVRRMGEIGIPVEVDAYGPGIHNWPYWQRELHRALPRIMRSLQT
jgi:S-formylglutathione hydrolase FrmB